MSISSGRYALLFLGAFLCMSSMCEAMLKRGLSAGDFLEDTSPTGIQPSPAKRDRLQEPSLSSLSAPPAAISPVPYSRVHLPPLTLGQKEVLVRKLEYDERYALEELKKRAHEEQDTYIQLRLGTLYEEGKWPVEKDEAQAVHYLSLAAQNGNLWAQCKLGRRQDRIPSTVVKLEEALTHLQAALEEGKAGSCCPYFIVPSLRDVEDPVYCAEKIASLLPQMPWLRVLILPQPIKWRVRRRPELVEGMTSAFQTMTQLSVLEFSEHISKGLIDAFQHMQQLEWLLLGQTTGEEIAALAPALSHLRLMQALAFRCMYVTEQEVRALAPTLHHMPHLQVLKICMPAQFESNYLGKEGARALAPALQHMTNLLRLDLRSNDFGAEGVHALAPVLQHMTGLEELDLSGSGGLPSDTLSIPLLLSEALQPMKNLISLTLGDKNLGGCSMGALAPVLQDMIRLQKLDLSYTPLKKEGARVLASVLPHITQLHTLALEGTKLKEAGIDALAPALLQLQQIRFLDLGWNKINDGGARVLAPALLQMTRMNILSLEGNNLTSRGALDISLALHRMVHMQILRLGSNSLRKEGLQALALGMCPLPKMRCLSVCENNLGVGGAYALLPILPRMPNLTFLDARNNGINEEEQEALKEALARPRLYVSIGDSGTF